MINLEEKNNINSFFGNKNSLESDVLKDEYENQEEESSQDLNKALAQSKEEINNQKLEINELESQINELNKKNQATIDALKDLHFDFENSKKRANDALNSLNHKLQKDIFSKVINLLDSFDRCKELEIEVKSEINLSDPFHKKTAVFMKGFEMMYFDLIDLLSKYNIKKIEVKEGDHFDENQHNAISGTSITKKDEILNTIVRVLRNGYKINDEVLRCADVNVFTD